MGKVTSEELVPALVQDGKRWRGCMPWRWPSPLTARMLDSALRARGEQLAHVLPKHADQVLRAVAEKLGPGLTT